MNGNVGNSMSGVITKRANILDSLYFIISVLPCDIHKTNVFLSEQAAMLICSN